MTNKQLLLTGIFSILILSPGRSQTNNFGKITDEEWNIGKCSFDTAAQAIVLFDVGTISISSRDGEINSDPICKLQPNFFRLVLERHKRIKILYKEGIKAASLSFTLHSVNGKKDNLTHFKGIAVRKANGKVITEKFSLKNLSESVKDDGSVVMTFMLPETTDGSIVDLSYIIESYQLDSTPEWNFSNDYPTLYSEINLAIPEFVQCQKQYTKFKNQVYESFATTEKYKVPYGTSWEGTRFNLYTFNVNHEKYALSSVPVYPKSDDTYILKYIFPSIYYTSVQFTSGKTGYDTGGSATKAIK